MRTVLSLALLAIGAPALTAGWTTLSDGTYMQSGSVSSTYRWQSSGELHSGGCSSSFGIKNCYTMRLGGYMTNLQNVTKDPELARRDLLHPVAARVAPVSDFEILAAEQDDNLEAFYRAFPEALADEQSALRKRQVVSNCTGPPPDPNEPPPPPADPRQRIEFLTWPAAPAGSNWSYRWKTRTLATPTGSKLHHHWQLLRRDACGGATVTLSFNNGRAIIKDSIRSGTTPSVDLNQWFGKTIIHSMNVTYGIKGFLSYTAVDAAVPSVPLIKYLARGDMGSSSSLKHGIYRTSTPDTQAITAFHGEWSAVRRY